MWLNSLSGLVGAGLAGRLDPDPGLLMPFSAAVLVGGMIGSRYGSRVSSQRGVKWILVAVLLLGASKRVLGIIG